MLSSRLSLALTTLVIVAFTAAGGLLLRPTGSAAASYAVTRFDDPAPGSCDIGDCSLREAVLAANGNAGADVITLPAGTYTFTIGGWEDASLGGDLDLTDDVTINGAGAATTIINANDTDRVISVLSGTTNVFGVTLRNGTGNYGGGVYTAAFTTATLNLTNVTVSDNVATGFAGGINNGGTMTLTNSTVIGNSTANQTGGILNNFGTMTITNSTVSANAAGSGPGGIYNYNGANLTITNSTIMNNTTNGSGGGIENGSGTMAVTNSTISGNTAKNHGGGIYTEATTTLTNVTITNNTADSDANNSGEGGGIYVPWWASASAKNTIIAGNIDLGGTTYEPDCHAPPDTGGLVSAGNNLIQATSGCTITGETAANVTGQPANLGSLTNNGGPTLTHALLAGSPAIDWGSADCPPPATDQRGTARPQGNRCDIGAFESLLAGPTPPPTPTPVPSPTASPTPTNTPTPAPSSTSSPTPTATPTPTPGSPTASVTPGVPTPTPTPSASPGGRLQGDVDCNGTVNSVDALKVLRFVAQLSVNQEEGCPLIGTDVASLFGDINCNDSVNSVDSLGILRFVAQLPPLSAPPECTPVGDPL